MKSARFDFLTLSFMLAVSFWSIESPAAFHYRFNSFNRKASFFNQKSSFLSSKSSFIDHAPTGRSPKTERSRDLDHSWAAGQLPLSTFGPRITGLSLATYLQSQRDLSIAGMYIQSRQHLTRTRFGILRLWFHHADRYHSGWSHVLTQPCYHECPNCFDTKIIIFRKNIHHDSCKTSMISTRTSSNSCSLLTLHPPLFPMAHQEHHASRWSYRGHQSIHPS